MAAGRRHAPAAVRGAGRHAACPRRRGRHRLCRLGTQCHACQRGRRFQPLGRPPPPDAPAPRMRRVGIVHPRRGRRRPLQIRTARPARPAAAAEGRSNGTRRRAAAGHRQRGGAAARHGAGQHHPPGGQRPGRADQHLRGAPRLVAAQARRGQPLADLGRAGRRAGAPCRPPGLHPHRAAADQRAPVRRQLGLPAAGAVCAHRQVRRRRRLPPLRTGRARGRPGCDPGLGARPLPHGRPRPGQLRRHAPV